MGCLWLEGRFGLRDPLVNRGAHHVKVESHEYRNIWTLNGSRNRSATSKEACEKLLAKNCLRKIACEKLLAKNCLRKIEGLLEEIIGGGER
ncbi:hypothetical protein [Methanosarcina acetivorans]|uniref:Uncharacterized protein n=1 Tax=Methanosarcina acetivorans (strain ATCC 35395 / DSM 2834 / JCM 12185 / C2A) TaxID=188937 RepID=Q8TN82_METAC|nr:hypothetical protein [Methanosarcina acetivorans]AAM05797.1 predicted protein [Methanosarcina acetivorans C2A]